MLLEDFSVSLRRNSNQLQTMKHLLPLIYFFLAWESIQAQDATYHPLVEEGKRWTYNNYLDLRPDKYNHYYWYFLQGDTIINGNICLKMYSENEYNDDKIIYKGSLYEEDRKVYYVNNSGKFALLYDFGGIEGDELTTEGGLFTVKSISTIENQEETLRMFELSSKEFEDEPDAEYMHFFWIEGVGCMKDFFAMIPFPGNYCNLVKCEVNGEILYQTAGQDIITSPFDKPINSFWHTLSGHRLSSPPTRKGVYIRDGRKVVVK